MTFIWPWLGALFACGRGDQVLLQDKGSDTMVNLMQRMSEEYTKTHPAVIVAVTGGGSGTGIKALVDGTTDMANCSRPISDQERQLAEKNGIHPHENVVAYDGLAIYVHKDNPVQRLDFEQLKCIYSAEGTCKRWSDLGVTIDCGGTDEIIKVGRQNNSGTYEYFRDEVLGEDGKFTNTLDQSGTQQTVDVVGTSACAIGYGGMGYHNDKGRFVCLARTADGSCSEPTVDNVKSGAYAFSRPLYVYTNGAPQGEVATFLDWAKSEPGQQVALDSGFVPVPK